MIYFTMRNLTSGNVELILAVFLKFRYLLPPYTTGPAHTSV